MTTSRALSRLVLVTAAAVTALATLVGSADPATAVAGTAKQKATPGSLTGYGFDTCSAPAQEVMDAWWQESAYSAVGIYIGGSSRKCDQPELSAGWVRTQVKRGWHLLPVYVGLQASCSGYQNTMSPVLATAGQQGRAEAAAAVAAARGLGIGKGSTLYYDLEDYDITPDDCRRAALSFLSGWTQGLRSAGYGSGVYSNLGAAITSLDYAAIRSPGSYVMPDDIWFAWDNGHADTVTDERVQSHEWNDHDRVHQYSLDVRETHGGYPLTIDRNWVDVGLGSVATRAKDLCRGVDVDLRRYPSLHQGSQGAAVRAAQCLLRKNRFTAAPVTGRYDRRTRAAVTKAQRRLHLAATGKLTRPTWVGLLARGRKPVLKVGSTGGDVRRLERTLTAALHKRVRIDGVFTTKTARAVVKYQRKAGLPATGVVTKAMWRSLQR